MNGLKALRAKDFGQLLMIPEKEKISVSRLLLCFFQKFFLE